MNVISRGIRNAFRNGIRTLAIVGMLALSIGLSLSMLLAHQAIGQKISEVQKNIGTSITVTPAGIRGFDGGGNPLATTDIAKIAKLSHVASVDETLMDRLSSDSTNLKSALDAGSFGRRQFRIENGNGGASTTTDVPDGQASPNLANFTPPISVTGASNPLDGLKTASGSSVALTSGKAFDGTKDAQVALIGKSLAEKNSLSVGSTFTAYNTTFTVSGIFDAGNAFGNAQVLMPLPTVQRLSDQAGAITDATVHVDSSTHLDSATTAIKTALGSKADVTNDSEDVKTLLGSMQNIKNVSLFSLIGAAGTAAIILLLTMIMIVRERRREIGVLKAIGASNVRVMAQFTVEAITLTVLAATIGIVVGCLAATPVTKLLASSSSASSSSSQSTETSGGPGGGLVVIRGGGFGARLKQNSAVKGIKNVKANVNPSIILYGLGGAVLIAIVGSTAAASLISRVRPAEVMRAE